MGRYALSFLRDALALPDPVEHFGTNTNNYGVMIQTVIEQHAKAIDSALAVSSLQDEALETVVAIRIAALMEALD